jgi:hypothetical protein
MSVFNIGYVWSSGYLLLAYDQARNPSEKARVIPLARECRLELHESLSGSIFAATFVSLL